MLKKPEDLRKLEEKLFTYEGEDKIVSSHELVETLDIETATFEKTGFPTIDRLLGGVEAGEMVIVSGPTGEGKTSLLMSMTKHMAEANIPALWFTLEVTPKSFVRKIKNSCKTMPLFYMPNRNSENQLEWLEHRIVEAKVKHDVKVVFIDHIHQIFSLHRVSSSNVSLEIGDMVGKIKQMAVEYNLVIFLIAHTKDNAMSPNAEPRKEDIRDSGLISRLADSIIMIWRVNNNAQLDDKRRPTVIEEDAIKAKIRVVKNRREGKLGQCLIDLVDGLFREEEF